MKKDAHGHHHHHITPSGVLAKTFIALLVLMALTIGASYIDFGNWVGDQIGAMINNVIMLTIAIAKAFLVVKIFMGVGHGTSLVKLWAIAGFVWVTLLALTFGDYFTRHWEPERGWYEGDTIYGQRESHHLEFPVQQPGHQQHGHEPSGGH
jgi:cytochrome c oxidase subunit IV